MKKKLAITLIALMAAAAVAQKKDEKPWTEWSKKDAEKMLSDSPWSKVQTDTDTSQMFYSPTQDPTRMGTSSNDSSRLAQGATNQSVNVSFQVHFFSARPVREALARVMEISNKTPADVTAKVNQFAEMPSPSSIIVTVTYASSEQRYSGVVMQE